LWSVVGEDMRWSVVAREKGRGHLLGFQRGEMNLRETTIELSFRDELEKKGHRVSF